MYLESAPVIFIRAEETKTNTGLALILQEGEDLTTFRLQTPSRPVLLRSLHLQSHSPAAETSRHWSAAQTSSARLEHPDSNTTPESEREGNE